MSSLPEIIRLFTKLASSLHRSIADDDDEAANAISSLTESVNSGHQVSSSVRVLDTALSLMCFKAPEVFSSNVECLLETIMAVLSSSVSCKVLRNEDGGHEEKEVLGIGSSIAFCDREKLIRACCHVLESLEGHGLYHSLLREVLRVVISVPRYQCLFPLSSVYYEKKESSSETRGTVNSNLSCLLPEETSVIGNEVPLRLLLWYLDPIILKGDISTILCQTIHRPFLCLKKELHERLAWRSIIICLVTSPTIFTEARALLHKWFLATGLASILELQIAIVSSALDVLSRPMFWGLSMELGLKLTFSHAYFPKDNHELLVILTGSISRGSFLDLVHHIGLPVAPTTHQLNSPGIFREAEAETTVIDHNSIWSMLMTFPAWFYFVAVLILCGKTSEDSSLLKLTSGAATTDPTSDPELCDAAARYLAFILSPLDEDNYALLIDCMRKIPKILIPKNTSDHRFQQQCHLETYISNELSRSKKLRKPKAVGSVKFHTEDPEGCSGLIIKIWLEEFHRLNAKYCRTAPGHVVTEEKTTQLATERSSLLFAKISLGILIGWPSLLDEKGCELLLHYSATGEILHMEEAQNAGRTVKRAKTHYGLDNSTEWPEGWHASEWAVDGAALVFNIFDIMENMSDLMFESGDDQLDFICQMKGKTCGYLLRCVKRLLEVHSQLRHNEDGGRNATLMDLYERLTRWRRQGGGEVFEGCEAIDHALEDLNRKFPLSHD